MALSVGFCGVENVESHQPHKLKTVGSTPTPATMSNKYLTNFRARQNKVAAPVLPALPALPVGEDTSSDLTGRAAEVIPSLEDKIENEGRDIPLDLLPEIKPVTELVFEGKGAVKAARLKGSVLEVAMSNGTHVFYANFTPALMREWQIAKSPAAWFHQNVRLKTKDFPEVKNG